VHGLKDQVHFEGRHLMPDNGIRQGGQQYP
jgi:hypothetical protein